MDTKPAEQVWTGYEFKKEPPILCTERGDLHIHQTEQLSIFLTEIDNNSLHSKKELGGFFPLLFF